MDWVMWIGLTVLGVALFVGADALIEEWFRHEH